MGDLPHPGVLHRPDVVDGESHADCQRGEYPRSHHPARNAQFRGRNRGGGAEQANLRLAGRIPGS
ncbi:MAG: hypothetical protein OXH09_12575 [Gammaproteobacteria bacterium]|nr:hypothetical protein [Gammaproteobacteria bacterium]